MRVDCGNYKRNNMVNDYLSPDTSRRVKMSFTVKCQTPFFSLPLAFNEPEIL